VHLTLRSLYLITAVLLLLILPIGQASVMLVLFVASVLAAAALMLRPETAPLSVAAIGGDAATTALLRRALPELRMRRPAVTIEAQLRWRQEAERHRRRREMF
jgi:hypothetical protein